MTDTGEGDDEFQFLRTVSEAFLNLTAKNIWSSLKKKKKDVG